MERLEMKEIVLPLVSTSRKFIIPPSSLVFLVDLARIDRGNIKVFPLSRSNLWPLRAYNTRARYAHDSLALINFLNKEINNYACAARSRERSREVRARCARGKARRSSPSHHFKACHTVTSFLGFWSTENQCSLSVAPLTPFPSATLPIKRSVDLLSELTESSLSLA